MWKDFLLKMKLKKATRDTRRKLIDDLCDPKMDYTWQDLYMLYTLLKQSGGTVFMSPTESRYTEVRISENAVDSWILDIKHIVQTFEIKVRINIRSENTKDIYLVIEFYSGDSIRRRTFEKTYEFTESISYNNLKSDTKTPKTKSDLFSIKKIMASAFEIIIDYMIDWRNLS